MKYAVQDEEQQSSRRGLGRRMPEPPEDTEITLGARSLVGIFFGLVLMCGVFFGLGYSVGRVSRGTTVPAADSSGLAQETGSLAKPSPQQAAALPAATPAADGTAAPASAPPTPAITAATATAPPTGEATPAVPAATAPLNSTPAPVSFPSATAGGPVTAVPAAAAAAVQRSAASAPARNSVMVQVAAVSVPRDAEILAAALRKHGFSPVVRHEPEDQLLHVQIGPFPTRSAANAVRGELLADGYNAVIR